MPTMAEFIAAAFNPKGLSNMVNKYFPSKIKPTIQPPTQLTFTGRTFQTHNVHAPTVDFFADKGFHNVVHPVYAKNKILTR